MKIPSLYHLTPAMVKLLQQIEHLKTAMELLPPDKLGEKFMRQKSLLQSALFSARIEGNPKTNVSLTDARNPKDEHHLAISNLYRSLEFILKDDWHKQLLVDDLKELHRRVLAGLSPFAGNLRHEPSAIFNKAGVAVYVCPMPEEVRSLLEQWLEYVNQDQETFIPIKAVLAHYAFEKIHPFLDGNGRVGRLLMHLILKKWRYDLKGLVAFEKYLDRYRDDYYYFLGLPQRDQTEFVEFFLRGIREELEKTLTKWTEKTTAFPEDSLTPRRFEILQIIRDHKRISFDFVRRRFLRVEPRLLRYDLKQLQDKKYIKKRGVTKGVVYEPIS